MALIWNKRTLPEKCLGHHVPTSVNRKQCCSLFSACDYTQAVEYKKVVRKKKKCHPLYSVRSADIEKYVQRFLLGTVHIT